MSLVYTRLFLKSICIKITFFEVYQSEISYGFLSKNLCILHIPNTYINANRAGCVIEAESQHDYGSCVPGGVCVEYQI